MDIRNKLVLVTGGSRGLGEAIAVAFANEGCHVLITYHVARDKANSVVEKIRKLGVKSDAFQVDIGNKNSVMELQRQVKQKYGDIDVLVNNAGAILRPAEWNLMPDDLLDKTIDLNLKGPLFCMQMFVPGMIEKKFGRIINFTTTYAIHGAAGVLAYTAAKAGVMTITTAMAKELAIHGITVNAIAPGNFDTEMTTSAGQGVVDWVISTTPVGRLGKPYEVGEAAVYLTKSEFITGHILVLDGGQILNI